MDVIYVFYKSGISRIPFFHYNKALSDKLTALGGKWNSDKNEFVFSMDKNAEKFSKNFGSIPLVWVDDDFPSGLLIYNFLGVSVNYYYNRNPVKSRINITEKPANRAAINLQNSKFSQYWQDRLETELRSRKYSPLTRRMYIYFNNMLCAISQKTPEEISSADIKDFLSLVEKNREYSASSMNLAISSIRFFYKNILKSEVASKQYRPRFNKDLPVVLSKMEVNDMLNTEKNIKHRLLLMLTYSSGLRVSEVVVLKREHIDISRGIIYIKSGKGRKDRYTVLSQKAVSLMNEYFSIMEENTWLFPGMTSSTHLSIRSAQKIFEKAINKAKIPKKLSIHSLRHSFATHLLENGTDIRYIQTLLGHSNIRTTERYTHIARRSILNIKSPLDT